MVGDRSPPTSHGAEVWITAIHSPLQPGQQRKSSLVLAHLPPSEGPHLSLSSSRHSTILFRSLTVFRYDSSSSFSRFFSVGVFRSSAQDKGSPSHSYR